MNRCPHCDQTHANTNHFCPVTGQPIELGPRLVSTSLLDKYRVLRVIGSGPIGSVLEVEDISTKVHFAAKLIHPKFTRDASKAAEQMIADLETVSRLDSPNIAKIYKVGRDTGYAITVIRELMTGECLSDRMEKVGQFSLLVAVKIVREILNALDAMHRVNVLNHDLSPSDIFLSSTDSGMMVKLVDIGERHIKNTLINDIQKRDSAKYYAPEQFDRSRQPNHRSDIYAAGAILYQMLTCKVPTGEPAPIESLRKDVPTALIQTVMKALSPTTNNRFQDAKEFIAALDTIDLDNPPKTPAVAASSLSSEIAAIPDDTREMPSASVIVEMPEIYKRRSKIAMAIGGLLVILLLIGGWYQFTKDDDATALVNNREDVTIQIKVVPKNATITIDGKRNASNPTILKVQPDNKLHTISAKAVGYESIERDVKFDESRVVTLELLEIIQPDEAVEPEVVATPAVTGDKSSALPKKSGASVTDSSIKRKSGNLDKKTKSQTPRGEKPKKKKKAPVEGATKKTGNQKKNKRFKSFSKENPFD